MSKINTNHIKATLLERMKTQDVITGGIFRPSFADRIKRRLKNAAITATIVITLLGPAVPRAIASSTDLKPKIEYVEKYGVYQEVINIRDLIDEIRRLFEQDNPDWKILKQRIDKLREVGKQLGDVDTINLADEFEKKLKLFYALNFVGEGNFTEAFHKLFEFIDESRDKGKKDWMKDGEEAVKLIKDMIGKETSSSGSKSMIAMNGGSISYVMNSYILIDSTNTFFVVKLRYASSFPESITKELIGSEVQDIKKVLRENYTLFKTFNLKLNDKDIIMEYGKDSGMQTITAKVLVDIR